MKYLLIIFQLVLINYSSVLSQNTTWSLLINTNDDRSITDIITDDSGNIFFTGLGRQADSYHFKGIIYKLNSEGTLVDSLFLYNNDSSIIVNSILPDTGKNFILGIETFGTTYNQLKCGFNLKRIDSALNILNSSKNYFFPEEYRYINIKIQYNNHKNVIVYGYIIFPNQTPRMFMYEINKRFDSIRANIYLNESSVLPSFIKQLPDNNYWVLRDLHSNYALIDSTLNMINAEEGEIPHEMNGTYGIKWDSDTSFYLAADYFDGFKNYYTGHNIGFIHQYHPFDTTGVIFSYTGAVDTNDLPAFYGALDYKNKDSIFIGYIKNINIYNVYFSTLPSWFVLLQTDSMLNVRWERFYGGDAYYLMTKIIATSDGGCLMAGTRYDYNSYPELHKRDIYILKVNAQGLITSIDDHQQPLLTIHDAIVYPNPGKNILNVTVAIQHPESEFKLYDLKGNIVLQAEIHGRNTVFNTTFLHPGTYVYTITSKTGLSEKGKWVKE